MFRTRKLLVGALLVAVAAGSATAIAFAANRADKPDVDAQNAQARAVERAKDENKPLAPPVDRTGGRHGGTLEPGIVETRQSPAPNFTQENEWDGDVAGKPMTVRAGSVATSDKGSSSVGVLLVTQLAPDLSETTSTATYRYDSVPGPFKIIAEKGGVLTLQGGDGSRFTYQVDANSFAAAP